MEISQLESLVSKIPKLEETIESLQNVVSNLLAQKNYKSVLTAQDVAEYAGVSIYTAREMIIKAGSVKVGKRNRVSKENLDRYLLEKGKKKKSDRELDMEAETFLMKQRMKQKK